MPADGPAVSDDAHISFAKRLAHNDKDMRRAALKKVKRWLVTKSKQGTLDQDEILKIWKGLHYSMWYSDKPLTQESLALDISQIVSLLPDIDDAVNFFGGFCETIAREWVGIDRQRLDKFYMFIKTALKCVLEFCAANNWNDEIVTNVVDTLDLRIINSQCPDSISVFISEHLFSIYSEVSSDSTPPLFITEMLTCYLTVLSKTPKKDLSQVIMSNLFNPIISDSVSFKINHEHLINFIARIAVQPDILTRNRKLLYRLRNDIATVGGVDLSVSSPLGKHQLENKDLIQSENVPNNQEQSEEAEVVKPPKKKKKKKVKQPAVESEVTVDTPDESNAETSDSHQPEKEPSTVSDLMAESGNVVESEDPATKEEEEVGPISVTAAEVTEVTNAIEADQVVEIATEDATVEPAEEAACVSEENTAQDKVVADVEKKGEDENNVIIDDARDDKVINEEVSDLPAEPAEDETTGAPDSVNEEETKEEIGDDGSEEVNEEETKEEIGDDGSEEVNEEETKEEIGDDGSEEVNDFPAEATEDDVPENVTEEEIKEDSNESGAMETTANQETGSVDQATESSEISPIAPSDIEVTKEAESRLKRSLRKPDLEVSYATPPKKTAKRKSTKSKKTPKKQAEEASSAIETVEHSDDKVKSEQSVEEDVLPSDEITGSINLNRSQASLRKRKKKKSLCSTPTPNSPSTPDNATLSTKKKVRLSMENNQTFFFKKNTSLESPKPFDSTRTPVKGVLKSSPALTRSQAKKKAKSRIKS